MKRGGPDPNARKERLFQDLVQECQAAVPVSRLTEGLRRGLERFPREDRRDIAGGTVDGCSPLFLACKNGSADVVEYLLSSCGADIEQRGLFEVAEEGISHHVTPLWCAAVSGRLSVVKVLLRYSADVDAVSDSGSTPIRSACYIVRQGLHTSHLDIIKCLVRAGANAEQPNHFGGTCLINSVQSPDLTKFLIDSGVDLNAADVQHKTALHYAVQENRLETVKMLLSNGADPFMPNKFGDDALRTACLRGSLNIFNYLLEKVTYDPRTIADAFELIGSTFLLDMRDVGSTLFFWRKALEIRLGGQYARYPKDDLYVHPVLGCMEFDSEDTLESVLVDDEMLRKQALLITERILGSGHKDTIYRYMYAGASYADAELHSSCASVWNYALQLTIRKETLLSCDTCFTARAISQLYMGIMVERGLSAVDLDDVMVTTAHFNEGLAVADNLLAARPVCKPQCDNYDIVLTTWIHLVLIMLKASAAREENGDDEVLSRIFSLVLPVLRSRPTTHQSGDSLLHLAVSSSSTLKGNSYLDERALPVFPSAEVADFFLKCGCDVHARNLLGETPLHVACQPANFETPVAETLLCAGAHLDAPDERHITSADILRVNEVAVKLDTMCFQSLKCLSARAATKHCLDLSVLPATVKDFVSLHMTQQQRKDQLLRV